MSVYIFFIAMQIIQVPEKIALHTLIFQMVELKKRHEKKKRRQREKINFIDL